MKSQPGELEEQAQGCMAAVGVKGEKSRAWGPGTSRAQITEALQLLQGFARWTGTTGSLAKEGRHPQAPMGFCGYCAENTLNLNAMCSDQVLTLSSSLTCRKSMQRPDCLSSTRLGTFLGKH